MSIMQFANIKNLPKKDFQLKIDYDNKPSDYEFEEMIIERTSWFCEMFQKDFFKLEKINRVETVHGYHYTVFLTSHMPLKPEILLLLQCWLGDDPKRVYFNLRRVLMGWAWQHSNVFFVENEKPETATVIFPTPSKIRKRMEKAEDLPMVQVAVLGQGEAKEKI